MPVERNVIVEDLGGKPLYRVQVGADFLLANSLLGATSEEMPRQLLAYLLGELAGSQMEVMICSFGDYLFRGLKIPAEWTDLVMNRKNPEYLEFMDNLASCGDEKGRRVLISDPEEGFVESALQAIDNTLSGRWSDGVLLVYDKDFKRLSLKTCFRGGVQFDFGVWERRFSQG